MKKAKHDLPSETTDKGPAGGPANQPATEGNGQAPHPGPPAGDVLQQATHWVQENQQLALLGAFGVGVFIGVLLRR